VNEPAFGQPAEATPVDTLRTTGPDALSLVVLLENLMGLCNHGYLEVKREY